MNNFNSKFTFKLTHDAAVKMIRDYYDSFSDISILSIEPLGDVFVLQKQVLFKGKQLIVSSYISSNKFASMLKNALIKQGYVVYFVNVERQEESVSYKIDADLIDNNVRTRKR